LSASSGARLASSTGSSVVSETGEAPALYCTTPSRARARRSEKSRRVLSDSTRILRLRFSMLSLVSSTTRLLSTSKFSASRLLTRAIDRE